MVSVTKKAVTRALQNASLVISELAALGMTIKLTPLFKPNHSKQTQTTKLKPKPTKNKN
jgi:hypothetical protein